MTDLEKLMCEYGITEENAVAEAECEGLTQEVKWEDLKWQRKNTDKIKTQSK